MATIEGTPPSSSPLGRYQAHWDTLLSRAYAVNWEVVAYVVIFIVAAITRFYDLGSRAMSHDESLHTFYSWRLYEDGDFQHTPLMHGPLLFHAVAFFYFLFGDSDFSARIYTALLGVLIVMMPLLFRRWLGRLGGLFASLGLLISPMMLYYSRYIRHDIPNIFFWLVMVYCVMQYIDGEKPRRPIWLYIFSGAMVLSLASKETAFIYIAIFGTFLAFYWGLRLIQSFGLRREHVTQQPGGLKLALRHGLGHLSALVVAVVLGYFIGYVLWYWHFASMGWGWVLLGAVGVLFLRLLTLAWDALRAAWSGGTSDDILHAIMAALALVASLVMLWGGLTFMDYNARIDTALTPTTDNSAFASQQNELDQAIDTAQNIDTWENWRLVGGLVTVGGAGVLVVALAVLGMTYFRVENPRLPSQTLDWLLNTLLLVLLAALGLAVLRIITMFSFDRIALYHVGVILAFYALLVIIGPVRTFFAREARPGPPMMFAEGLAHARSASMVIIAGAVLGGVVAVYAYGVLDILKPALIWCEVPDVAGVVVNDGCNIIQGAEFVDEDTPTQIRLNTELGNALLLWLGVPILGVGVLIVSVAMLATPVGLRVPWTDVMAVLLVAFMVGGILKYVERHSFETEDENVNQPVAIDPDADAGIVQNEEHDDVLLVVTVLAFLSLAAFVIAWRVFLPLTWDWFNRQPVFDVLILTGTLIVPWAVAFPIFTAGYELDVIPPPTDTARVMILILAASGLFVGAVGLSWNPRVWTIAVLVFLALFVFFFTTVFTNGAGFLTGMVGSLGYWLEQQGVRRGSQPQYYYSLIQVPMYEFLPALLAGLAGVAGLADLFHWRARRLAAENASQAQMPAPDDERPPSRLIEADQLSDLRGLEADMTREQFEMDDDAPTDIPAESGRPPSRMIDAADLGALDDDDAGRDTDELVHNLREALAEDSTGELDMASLIQQRPDLKEPFEEPPRDWARPYDHAEEQAQRARDPEWLGDLPFLSFTAYWAILMLAGLSIAGEKMPWLTTHITLPLIFLGAWFAGRVVERITPEALRRGGWLLLVALVPVLLVSGLRVLSPLMGGDAPFAGVQQTQLSSTYAWVGALLVFGASAYFVARLSVGVGFGQTSRLAFASVTLILALLTGRAAVMASFQNYDLATELLVYAHASPRITTVMEAVDYYAERTNEGFDMRVAYDDQSSWPMTWYMRDYNSAFFAGDPDDLEANPGVLDDVRVVVVGERKANAVDRILGDNYYRYDYVRLWWPMQEYFNLNYDRVTNLFDDDNPAASLYREGIWDIWWNRDYDRYGQAQCVESRASTCQTEANPAICVQNLVSECADDDRYALNRWPVSDRFSMFVDEDIAVHIWDAGIGGETVADRQPQSVLDQVYRDLTPLQVVGEAVLNGPRGVAVGPAGNTYVADTQNSRILVFSPDGELAQIIGRPAGEDEPGAATPGTLFQPWGVDVAQDGTLYVADTWNHRVVVFSAQGVQIDTWGGYGVPEDGENPFALWGPRDLALDNQGNVIVADTGGKRLRVYSPTGEWLRDIGSSGSGLGGLDEPVGVDVNPISGEIYVADTWNQRVQVFDSAGNALRQWEVPMWYEARSDADRPYLAVSPDGRLIAVTDMNNLGRNDGPRVVVYDLAGNPVLALNAPEENFEAGQHGLRVVGGLAFAPDGSLNALDVQTGRLLRFPPLPVGGGLAPAPETSQQNAPDTAPADDGLGEPIAPPLNLSPSDDETTVPPEGAAGVLDAIPRGVALPGTE